MKLALIPPYARIGDIEQTDYQLALAHIMLGEGTAQGIAYAGAYLDAQERGDFVILDNGAYEGSLVNSRDLTAVANMLRPNEVVIPDVIKDAAMTIDRAETYHHFFQEKLADGIDLMFVAQGSNESEFYHSLNWAKVQDWIATIAIPRHAIATCEDPEARIKMAKWLNRYAHGKNVHFLGASPLWTEEIIAARDSGVVRGMDTSMPYVYGYSYEHWPSKAQIDSADSRAYYFDLEGDKWQNDIITSNVKGMIGSVQ